MSDSLKNFLVNFVAEHALTSGGELVLDVSTEELAFLGDFFLRGICGWALGLEADRTRPRLIEVTSRMAAADEEENEGIDETDEEIEPVN